MKGLNTRIQKKCKKLKMDKNRQNKNYNKIEYCLGSGLELLSAPTVLAVCQDSSVLRIR